MEAQTVLVLVCVAFLAFVGFSIYFFFKILEFVIKAINLYEKMINRQEATISLLQDIKNQNSTIKQTVIQPANTSEPVDRKIKNASSTFEEATESATEDSLEDGIIKNANKLGLIINKETTGYSILRDSSQIRFVFDLDELKKYLVSYESQGIETIDDFKNKLLSEPSFYPTLLKQHDYQLIQDDGQENKWTIILPNGTGKMYASSYEKLFEIVSGIVKK